MGADRSRLLTYCSFVSERIKGLYPPKLLDEFENFCDDVADEPDSAKLRDQFVISKGRGIMFLGPEIDFSKSDEVKLCCFISLATLKNSPSLYSQINTWLPDHTSLDGHDFKSYSEFLKLLEQAFRDGRASQNQTPSSNKPRQRATKERTNTAVPDIYDDLHTLRGGISNPDLGVDEWNAAFSQVAQGHRAWVTLEAEEKLQQAWGIHNETERLERLSQILGLPYTFEKSGNFYQRVYVALSLTLAKGKAKEKLFKPTLFSKGHPDYFASCFDDACNWGNTVDLATGEKGVVEAVAPAELTALYCHSVTPVGVFELNRPPDPFPSHQIAAAAKARFSGNLDLQQFGII